VPTAAVPASTGEHGLGASTGAGTGQPKPRASLTRGAHRDLLYRTTDASVCAPQRAAPAASATQAGDNLIHLGADAAEYFADKQAVHLIGAVEISQPPQRMLADEATYNGLTGEIDARGNLFYERPQLRLESAGGTMNLNTYEGSLQDVEFRLPEQGARGVAQSIQSTGKTSARLTDASYTTCPPGSQDWSLDAAQIDLHQDTGLGEARDAKLELGGVPVLYLPYLAFPLGTQRQSGFLAPSLGYSDSSGVSISTPYYFNLAPNYDATLTPRILSDRGLMLGGELRFLTEEQQGTLQGEVLPQDYGRDDGGTRGALYLKSSGVFAERWTTDVDVNYVSDSKYLTDLGNNLDMTSKSELERRGDLVYHGDDWSFLTRVQGFQTVDQTILPEDRPYSRLPQALFTLDRPLPIDVPVSVHLDTEYVNFSKDHSVQGQRVDVYPSLSVDLSRPWGYLRSKLGLRDTIYSLDGQAAGASGDPQRTLPVASLDTGLTFERSLQLAGQAYTQTLEPRLFYLYVPRRTQDDLPVFDTSERDLTFDALFQENRFNGADRIGDANQLSVGLSSRTLQASDGTERLRLGIGQIYYFEDRLVQLPNTPTDSSSASPIVATALARIAPKWTLAGDLQWDPDTHQTESGGARIQYRDDENRILNLAYRVRRDQSEHSDISARWPLGTKTHLVARWDYSWQYNRTIEAFGGIEYNSCCWVLRAVARDWTTDLQQGTSNLGVFLQLELKGLGSLGSSVDDLLQHGILGYGKDH
jgi:LPS-assembly protein